VYLLINEKCYQASIIAGASPLMCASTIDNINIRAKILLIAWDKLDFAFGRTFRDIFLMKQLNFLIYYQTRELEQIYKHTERAFGCSKLNIDAQY
jgi:hypothetical protein